MRFGANDWLISQNLLNANLTAIEFVPQESLRFAAGDAPQDVLLVGGRWASSGPSARPRTSSGRSSAANLPNARVDSIKFVSFDPATYEGRGQLPSDPS